MCVPVCAVHFSSHLCTRSGLPSLDTRIWLEFADVAMGKVSQEAGRQACKKANQADDTRRHGTARHRKLMDVQQGLKGKKDILMGHLCVFVM